MANTTFQGPLRVGIDTGTTATSTIGRVLVTQVATVNGAASGATNIVVPKNAEITGWQIAVVSAASAATSIAGQGLNFRIGRVAGNDAWFATIKVSGPGMYTVPMTTFNPPANVSALSNFGASVTADTQVFVDATAVTSASATGQLGARLYCTYFKQ
jgi:hypothetical protein